MPKKYRLIRPCMGGGGIIAKDTVVEKESDSHEWYYTVDSNRNPFHKKVVETFPTWFEEIKEKERIEVMDYELQQEDNNGHFHYTLKFNKYVNFNKDWPKIIESIESILNNEQPIEEKTNREKYEDWQASLYVSGVEYIRKPSDTQPLTGEFITKEECERRVEEAHVEGYEAGKLYGRFHG